MIKDELKPGDLIYYNPIEPGEEFYLVICERLDRKSDRPCHVLYRVKTCDFYTYAYVEATVKIMKI